MNIDLDKKINNLKIKKYLKKNINNVFVFSINTGDQTKYLSKLSNFLEYVRNNKYKKKIILKVKFADKKNKKNINLKKTIIKEILRSYNIIYSLKIKIIFNEYKSI